MTFILHGFMVGYWFRKWWWVCALVAIQGALPDLIGAYGNWFLHDNYQLYLYAHQYLWFEFPFGWLHVFIDKFWHQPAGGWYWWGYVVEPAIWIAIIYFLFFFKKKVKNENSEAQDWTMQTK